MDDRPPGGRVFPFGDPGVIRSLAPNPGLSQLVASFIASMSQGIRHAPFPTFSMISASPSCIAAIKAAEPLILSAVLIVKYSLLGLTTLRSTSLKLKLKSYFLQFVLCQYVKDLLHLPFNMYNVQFVLAMRRGEERSRTVDPLRAKHVL